LNLPATRIVEIKTTLAGERKEFDCELLKFTRGEVVVIYRMPGDVQLEDLLLPKDTISIGYFWDDRAYNAYHWIGEQSQSLALYFNICDNTRISRQQVAWRDLSVDVLITPDLRCRVLDEDELPDDLDSDLRVYIESARDALCVDPARLLLEFEARRRELLPGA
jgi:predicted RNA-binding protein associated with RNAse of E/G family